MIRRASILLIALFSSAAAAQPFIEVGVGAAIGGCITDQRATRWERVSYGYIQRPGCSRSPLGLIAVGYEFNDRWRIQWDHWSSIPDTRDRGMEILSIRYRYTFK